MPEFSVSIKHAGRTHALSLNTDLPATAFKQSIYEVTGVPVDRMKVMVKGGVLKDDHDWSKVQVKENMTLMVIGAAGPLPKAPEKPIVFLEDLDEADLASAVSIKSVSSISRAIDALRTTSSTREGLAEGCNPKFTKMCTQMTSAAHLRTYVRRRRK